MADENCFKLFFIHRDRPVVAIELISTGEEEEASDGDIDDETDEEREYKRLIKLPKWWDYVRRYASDVRDDENEQDSSRTHRPLYLNRNAAYRKSQLEPPFSFFSFSSPPPKSGDKEQMQFLISSGLKAVLASENVRLLYVKGTSDIMVRVGPRGEDSSKDVAEERHIRFEEWVNAHNGVSAADDGKERPSSATLDTN